MSVGRSRSNKAAAKKTVIRRKKAPAADGELKTYYAPKAKKIYRPKRYPFPSPGGDQ